DTGEIIKAEDYLKKAFSLASENKYSMFWDIHLPTIAEISIYCIKNGIYAEYAEELIKKYFKQEAAAYIKRSISMSDEVSIKDLSEKTLQMFGIAGNYAFTYAIDIHLFGRFTISVNGITIPDSEWKTKKIKGILKYLLLHKGKLVTRDQLMETFWPDSDKKYAAMSLSAALYTLKKVLLKYGIKNECNTRFIYETSGGLEIKPNNMLFTDVDKFRQLYNDYNNRNNNGMDKKQELELLGRMASIYTGDMLEEETYSDWSHIDREELKTIFLEVSTALALLYIEEKELITAEKLLLRILAQDPYNEEVCFHLINTYILLNQRSRAVKLYSDFEKRLKKEMNIDPDAKLFSALMPDKLPNP
uniref:AfsR/SARP family transcriptional regulator n=1 Tax=Macellibacteroides fermentans TaxID=879969 RepID=UPI00406CE9CA